MPTVKVSVSKQTQRQHVGATVNTCNYWSCYEQ